MTNITECDGCGIRIGPYEGQGTLAVSGRFEPLPGLAGHAGRDGTFHWCITCTRSALQGIRAQSPPDTRSDEDHIREAMAQAEEHPGKLITR